VERDHARTVVDEGGAEVVVVVFELGDDPIAPAPLDLDPTAVHAVAEVSGIEERDGHVQHN